MRSAIAKRLLDLAIAVPALIVTLPVQIIVAVLVGRILGRPVLFRQIRPGIGGRPFELLKFRSMRQIDPAKGWTDDRSRITPLGEALRATSLDELPTLWNVVRGDMSVVGPRPLLMQYLQRYTPEQARRHEVKPGLTGLAQIAGRNALSWERKFALDVEYVDKRTAWLDVKILFRTPLSVLKRENVAAPGHATMPEFLGSGSGEKLR